MAGQKSRDMRADLVIVKHVTGRELEVPIHPAGLRVPGNRAVGVEVIARSIGGVKHRHRIASSPEIFSKPLI